MKVIHYDNVKTEYPVLIDISTEEKKKKGFLRLFELIDEKAHTLGVHNEEMERLERGIEKQKEKLKKVREMSENGFDAKELFDVDENWVEEELEDWKRTYERKVGDNKLYNQAKDGDWEAAKKLLEQRSQYPGESWRIMEVENPINSLEEIRLSE